jgi:ketopantoate hydroxymethyltransferase
VLQDLLGLSDWQPAFAPPVINLGAHIADAARRWTKAVTASELGAHPYTMSADELAKWR